MKLSPSNEEHMIGNRIRALSLYRFRNHLIRYACKCGRVRRNLQHAPPWWPLAAVEESRLGLE